MQLTINLLLTGGIIAATAGFIAWLADPVSVAILGGTAFVSGIALLRIFPDRFSMFGNAAALIGAGLLIGGASVELATNYVSVAPWTMSGIGALIAMTGLWCFLRRRTGLGFLIGSITLMGTAMHLFGLAAFELEGFLAAAYFLYAAAIIFGAGILFDLRFLSALAILPFAQMLGASTSYWHAAYAFYSPEATLSICQMGGLAAVFLWLRNGSPDRIGRHLGVAAILAFVVMNMCFLVGSLWGDEVGRHIWAPNYSDRAALGIEKYSAALEAYRANAITISAEVYSVVWLVLLLALIAFSAIKVQRGLLNASLTFLGIHLYTQMFESYGEQPLAWALGGVAAIPAAWGLLQVNRWIKSRQAVPI